MLASLVFLGLPSSGQIAILQLFSTAKLKRRNMFSQSIRPRNMVSSAHPTTI